MSQTYLNVDLAVCFGSLSSCGMDISGIFLPFKTIMGDANFFTQLYNAVSCVLHLSHLYYHKTETAMSSV